MTLDEIIEMWEKDAPIDPSIAGDVSLQIPILHHKYLSLHARERAKLEKMREKKKMLYIKLEGYYNGSIDGRDIGRPPFELRLTNDGVKKRIEADEEYIKRNIMIIDQESIVDYLFEVVKAINNRSFHIKNFVEMVKYNNGVG